MWYRFSDLHSGGFAKTKYHKVYIEAPDDNDAEQLFTQVMGRNPHNVTCTCCGVDYSIIDFATLDEATEYERECYGESSDEYAKRDDVLIIFDGRGSKV